MDCVNCKCIVCGEDFRARKDLYQVSQMPAFGIEGDAHHNKNGKDFTIRYRTNAFSRDGDICPYCCTVLTAVDIIQLVRTDPNFKKNLNNPERQETRDEEI